METNSATQSGSGGVGAGGIDERAWIENQVLAHELTAARQRLELARENGSPESRLRRLERDVDRAGEAIYLGNRGLARKIAGRYARRAGDADDLYQVADEALWGAIQTWEPTASPLASWAYRRIDKACRVHVAKTEHGLSTWSWEHRPAVLQAAQQLRDAGEQVDPVRVAEIADVTVELATLLLERQRNGADRSLDAPVGDDGTTFADLLVLEDPSSEIDSDDDLDAIDMLAELTSGLSIVDLFVWLRTHGADQAAPWPTEGLEQLLGVSAETVRRAARRADATVAAAAAEHDDILVAQ